MAIGTYSELKSAVENWLARSDLTLRIPEFIALAEAKFNRSLRLRILENRATTDIDTTSDEPEFISLPSDFQVMRRARLSGVTGKPRLQYLSMTQLDEFRYSINNASGQPLYFTVSGTEMEIAPTPDANYEIEMVYRANVTALSDTNTTSSLLTLAPDLYLYGALLEASPYIQNDQRIPLWASALKTVIDDLNQLSDDSAHGALPLVVRTSTQVV